MDSGTIIALIISGACLLVTLVGGAIAYGVVKQKVEDTIKASGDLEKRNDLQDNVIKELATKVELQSVVIRANEDRERNDKRIEELYNSRNEHAKIMATIGENMKNLSEALIGLKSDLKEGFTELKNDIKDIKRPT
jgi:hypothetical protein